MQQYQKQNLNKQIKIYERNPYKKKQVFKLLIKFQIKKKNILVIKLLKDNLIKNYTSQNSY